MMPLCVEEGVGVIPWSPLARGRLTRPWDVTTARSENDEFGRSLYDEGDEPIVDAVGKVAESRDLPRAQVALAWLLAQPGVDAPIVGATKPKHLADAVAALDVELTDDERESLEAAYRPHAIAGFV